MKRILLIGKKLDYSESPKIHKLISKYINKKYIYESIEIKNDYNVKNFIKNIKNFDDILGLNITTPYKEEIYKYCNKINKTSILSKSVNTIKIYNNKIYGCNTDGIGLIYDFKRLKYDNNTNILIIGAGGAAKSIISILYYNNYNIFLTNRTFSKLIDIKKYFKNLNININILNINDIKKSIFDIILNATSSGIYNKIPNINKKIINSNVKIYDLYYNVNNDTPFIKWCKNNKTLYNNDGIGMLIAQAIYSTIFWFNLKIKKNNIKYIFNKILNNYKFLNKI